MVKRASLMRERIPLPETGRQKPGGVSEGRQRPLHTIPDDPLSVYVRLAPACSAKRPWR